MTETAEPERAPRSTHTLVILSGIALLCIGLLLGLGAWQLNRLGWKLELIAQVNARVHAAATPFPGPATWPEFNGDSDEYRHVSGAGQFLSEDESLVEAVTDNGPGYWVMTPFRTDQGFVVMVNRGFVPSDRRDAASRAGGNPTGAITVAGLLRVTEPGGGFLRSNDPAHDRWYSRDVAAIAAAHSLTNVAPYFVDADATPNPGGLPIGGLTVIDFPNNHLVYALTWFALALMLAAASAFVARNEWRVRHRFAVDETGSDAGPAGTTHA